MHARAANRQVCRHGSAWSTLCYDCGRGSDGTVGADRHEIPVCSAGWPVLDRLISKYAMLKAQNGNAWSGLCCDEKRSSTVQSVQTVTGPWR